MLKLVHGIRNPTILLDLSRAVLCRSSAEASFLSIFFIFLSFLGPFWHENFFSTLMMFMQNYDHKKVLKQKDVIGWRKANDYEKFLAVLRRNFSE